MEGYLIEEDQSAGGRGVLVPVHSALSGGQPAPLSAQARISAPNAACVPGAGVRRPPGIQAQPTRLSSDTWWSSASMSFAPLRAGSLICSQIAPSERPCHPMDAGARRQAPPRRRSLRRDGRCRRQGPARRFRRRRARPRAGAAPCGRSGLVGRPRDDSSGSADSAGPCPLPGTRRSISRPRRQTFGFDRACAAPRRLERREARWQRRRRGPAGAACQRSGARAASWIAARMRT